MAATRTQIGIAIGAGALLVFGFVGYLWWLNNQGPVLARSEEHDPLTGLPVSIKMNPLRDRSTENYHKKYARYICQSEAQHPLLSWELVDWEDAPPLVILHYRGKRPSNAGPNEPGIDQDLFTLTVENKAGQWTVTKYDAMY